MVILKYKIFSFIKRVVFECFIDESDVVLQFKPHYFFRWS